jgi:hypothetical protein
MSPDQKNPFPFAMTKFWNVEFPPPDWTPFME